MSHACIRHARLTALIVIAALLPAMAAADVISPFGGGRTRPPGPPTPPPPPPSNVELPAKIRQAGFDCAQLDAVRREAPPGIDAAKYAGLSPHTVTCTNGKRFMVALPLGNPQDDRSVVLPLE